ncbi:Teneurin-1 and related extracellular matrix protein, partial [Globisporangium splendens]
MLGVQKVTLLSVALLGFICFQQSDAYCPNGCNAQGTCCKNDRCTCYLRRDELLDLTYPAYKGADCSLRTCPYGDAWVSVPTATNVAHPKVECSNNGRCDYSTDHCECFAGYEGKAGERTVCPNNCNNRGICLTLAAIIAGAPNAVAAYQAWDADKHMGCFCDQGCRGPDCSLKECPNDLDCGGRGKCNYDTDDCECFLGYYGTSCESQTTVH